MLLGDRLEGLKLPEGTAAYKVRIANTSANVGKSNGFRLLYYVAIEDEIYLLTIYSKKDDDVYRMMHKQLCLQLIS